MKEQGQRAMQKQMSPHLRVGTLDKTATPNHTSLHIRPMAVSPLTHPEGVPIPWGFSVFSLPDFPKPGIQP